jgi:hypothetical protein
MTVSGVANRRISGFRQDELIVIHGDQTELCERPQVIARWREKLYAARSNISQHPTKSNRNINREIVERAWLSLWLISALVITRQSLSLLCRNDSGGEGGDQRRLKAP